MLLRYFDGDHRTPVPPPRTGRRAKEASAAGARSPRRDGASTTLARTLRGTGVVRNVANRGPRHDRAFLSIGTRHAPQCCRRNPALKTGPGEHVLDLGRVEPPEILVIGDAHRVMAAQLIESDQRSL